MPQSPQSSKVLTRSSQDPHILTTKSPQIILKKNEIKLDDRSRGQPEGPLFISFYQLVGEGASN